MSQYFCFHSHWIFDNHNANIIIQWSFMNLHAQSMKRESRGMYDMLVLWIDVSNFILPRLVIFSIFSISFPLKSNIIFDGVFALKIFALAMLVLIPVCADVPVILIIFPALQRACKKRPKSSTKFRSSNFEHGVNLFHSFYCLCWFL